MSLHRDRSARLHAAPEPPSELVEETLFIRNLLLQSPYAHVTACCLGASLILGWRLRQKGWAPRVVPCALKSEPEIEHDYCQVGGWILDPTREQFRWLQASEEQFEGNVLFFQPGAAEDWYDELPDVHIPISEEMVVVAFARWLEREVRVESGPRSDAIVPLLEAAG